MKANIPFTVDADTAHPSAITGDAVVISDSEGNVIALVIDHHKHGAKHVPPNECRELAEGLAAAFNACSHPNGVLGQARDALRALLECPAMNLDDTETADDEARAQGIATLTALGG